MYGLGREAVRQAFSERDRQGAGRMDSKPKHQNRAQAEPALLRKVDGNEERSEADQDAPACEEADQPAEIHIGERSADQGKKRGSTACNAAVATTPSQMAMALRRRRRSTSAMAGRCATGEPLPIRPGAAHSGVNQSAIW